MGRVFRARDPRLNRDVAVKLLPPEFSADPSRRARFPGPVFRKPHAGPQGRFVWKHFLFAPAISKEGPVLGCGGGIRPLEFGSQLFAQDLNVRRLEH